MNKVSIIIPVYNAQEYIKKCVASFLVGSYQNIEILLIDDGSADSSLEVMRALEKENSEKIIVYTQKNCGVARTRNKGIIYATGKYIMFADNDDYVDEDYVERLVREIEKGDYDYIVSSFRRVDKRGKVLYQKMYKDTPWTYYMFETPWAKIFNREFLLKNEIKYMNVPVGEDIYFSICANWKSKKKKVIPYVGYNWLYNEASVSNTIHKEHSKDNVQNLAKLFQEILVMYERYKDKVDKKDFRYFLLKTLIWYSLYTAKGSNIEQLYNNYKKLKLFCDESLSDLYQDISLFSPKGESLKVRFIIKIVIIFDKAKLLKMMLKLYAKI